MSDHFQYDLKMYGEIKLYAGSGSPDLAQKIANYLQQPLSPREVIQFSNENIFVKLKSSARGQDVYVIQTTSSPVHYNLMELLIMIQTIRLDSAARITAVIPYLCYGRSDKKDQPRVPITARLVADMIEIAGADRYMTFDPHAGQIQGFFSVPGDVLTASHMISDHIKATLMEQMKDPAVVAADLGFAKKGRNYALDLDVPIAFIEKRRIGSDAHAEALTLIGEVQERDVIIVDDEVLFPGIEPPPEGAVNYKPLVAALFAIVLAVIGLWSSRRRPWKGGKDRMDALMAFAFASLPFVLAEAVTGIASYLTGQLSIPPVLGIGTAIDSGILVTGLVIALARMLRSTD